MESRRPKNTPAGKRRGFKTTKRRTRDEDIYLTLIGVRATAALIFMAQPLDHPLSTVLLRHVSQPLNDVIATLERGGAS